MSININRSACTDGVVKGFNVKCANVGRIDFNSIFLFIQLNKVRLRDLGFYKIRLLNPNLTTFLLTEISLLLCDRGLLIVNIKDFQRILQRCIEYVAGLLKKNPNLHAQISVLISSMASPVNMINALQFTSQKKFLIYFFKYCCERTLSLHSLK